MNELMTLIDQYEKARDKALDEIAERQRARWKQPNYWKEVARERAIDARSERDIEEYYEQAEGDFEAEGFEL